MGLMAHPHRCLHWRQELHVGTPPLCFDIRARDGAISRVGGHPLETVAGDCPESKITSTHTILTADWDTIQQLRVLETRSTHTLRQTSWVDPPCTGFVSNLDRGLAIPGSDTTGLIALSPVESCNIVPLQSISNRTPWAVQNRGTRVAPAEPLQPRLARAQSGWRRPHL